MYRVMLEIVPLELLTLYMMNYDYMTFICFIVCAYIIINIYVSFRLKHFMHCNLDVLILSTCPNKVWYELLTNKEYYEACLNINDFALRFLVRTYNECSVEVEVSNMNAIDTSSRPLKHITSEKLLFISSNGPHLSVSLMLVEDALNLYFKGNKWHFVLRDTKYFTSKVVDRRIREAEGMANDLACVLSKDSAYRCFVLLYVYVLFANGAPFNPMSTTYV